MRRSTVLWWTLWIIALPSLAQSTSLVPEHEGYAFDQPRLLVQQRLFGIAHGVTLLAATCVHDPEYRDTLIPVYEQWREKQQATIERSRLELARHYFGEHAQEASRTDVARALKLRPALGFKPGSRDLNAACNTFVEALQKPDYDLRQLSEMIDRLAKVALIETKVAYCRATQPGELRAVLDESMLAWHKSHDAAIEEARSSLEQRWPDPQFANALDRWLDGAATHKTEPANAAMMDNTQPCDTIAPWLLTRQADPDDETGSNKPDEPSPKP